MLGTRNRKIIDIADINIANIINNTNDNCNNLKTKKYQTEKKNSSLLLQISNAPDCMKMVLLYSKYVAMLAPFAVYIENAIENSTNR